MQFLEIFSLFIGTFVTVHFVDLIAKQFNKRSKTKELNNKRPDWYCFFSPNVFLRKDSTEKSDRRAIQENVTRDRRSERQREQRRPALRV